MKKILVTGAAGFIGYFLVRSLIKQDAEVIGLDNINDYYDVNLKYNRLVDCGIPRNQAIKTNQLIKSSEYNNYSFINLDIADYDELSDLFEKEKFDVVVNLAAQAGVRYSLENPRLYVKSNVVGFINLLECCRYNNIKHFVYASSSSVYGMTDKQPFSEDDRVDFPVSLYAATKKSDELMAHTYSHLFKLPTTGLRFFTVYGPWGRPDMAPMLFAKAIYENTTIKVFNGGDMLRDFTYIDDIIEGIIRVIDKIPTENNTHPYYELLNIGNSEPVLLMSFIETLETTIGKKAILEMSPMQAGDVKATYADVTKLQGLVGYKPCTPLRKGIEVFIHWYKDYYKKGLQ